MPNNIISTIKRIQNSKEFQEWFNQHKLSYMSSIFYIGNDLGNITWQVDYYISDENKMASFIEENGQIKFREENVFKKPGTEIKKLDIQKVKIDVKKAIAKLEKLKKKKFPGENPSQKIVILQNLDTILWNITYINTSFNILNVKINAINGKIIENSLTPIVSFKDKKYDNSALDKIKK